MFVETIRNQLFSMMPAFYSRNMSLAYLKIRSYFALNFIARANIGNIGICQSAIPMTKTVIMAALYGGVSVIFCLCSYAQMCRVNARRIVANVHNYFSKRYFFPGKKFIRISVRSYLSFTRQQKNTISVSVFCSSPKPTSGCFFYSGFKNIGWAKLGKLMQRSVLVRSLVTRPAKFSPYGRGSITNNANNCSFRLISHFNILNGTSSIYLINGGG